MYCKYCGGFNEDGSAFCSSCGKTIGSSPANIPVGNSAANTGRAASSAVKKPGNFFRKYLILFILLGVLIIAAAGAVAAGFYFTDPQRTADRYFSALAEKDWQTAYDCLYIKDSEFVSSAQFEMAMKNSEDLPVNVGAYNISEVRNDKYISFSDGFSKKYRVDYMTDRSSSKKMYINLVKDSEKQFLFFDNYKVSAADMLTSIEIYVPDFTTVTLDGTPVGSSYCISEDEGMCRYKIPTVFRFNHTILVQSDITEDYEIRSYSDAELSPGYLKLNNKTSEAVMAQAMSDFKQLAEAAQNGNDLEKSSSLYKSYHDYFYDYLYNSGEKGVHEYVFDNFIIDPDSSYLTSDQRYVCYFDFDYTYKYYYYDSEYQDGKRVDILKSEDRSDSGDACFYYTYSNGTWVIDTIHSVYY